MAVFYCDLDTRKLHQVKLPKTVRVERLHALSELTTERLQAITSFWSPTLAERNIRERFGKGASLWLVECGDRLAGYGWTLHGQSIAPYYFPLGPDDVQFFDFYVFPKFRGRAFQWLLISYILHTLAVEGRSRAFADTHEWNQPQLASLKITPFRLLGYVQTYKLLGRELTRWIAPRLVKQDLKGTTQREDELMKALGSNE
jgi:hypothetical protein